MTDLKPHFANWLNNNEETRDMIERAKLDRRRERKAVKVERRKETRRPSDQCPEAICARVILRALYEKGDMRAFDAYWKISQSLFK